MTLKELLEFKINLKDGKNANEFQTKSMAADSGND